MPAEEWRTTEHVDRYLGRADEFPRRMEGESVLLDHVPRDARRVLDLGTGDGRLLALLRRDRPSMLGVGLDFSELMLEAARKRFAHDSRIGFVTHDLDEALPELGRFDAVVSSMAIHHLEHERKRSLYGLSPVPASPSQWCCQRGRWVKAASSSSDPSRHVHALCVRAASRGASAA